jgi:hypothetical protein
VLQVLPEAALEVNITEFPGQIDVGPFAEIVGVGGTGFTVTVAEIQAEAGEQDELPFLT